MRMARIVIEESLIPPRRGDEDDETLIAAMRAFAVVGTIGIVIAALTGRIALAVDSAHNICEVPILGSNRIARLMEVEDRSHIWTCLILPLVPALSACAAIGVAAVFLAFGQQNETLYAVWIACIVELLSLVTNGYFAKRLHSHHRDAEADANVVAAVRHLVGDTGAAAVAFVAYLIIWIAQDYVWLDPVAAYIGLGLIVGFHIEPIKKSLRAFWHHQQPGHSGCVNSPPSQC